MVQRLGRLDSRPLERSAAADGVYEALREAIVSKRLLPGDRLAEEQLAKQFGVSRTPVREALLRLETEQFAMRVARRGLVVRPIPEAEVLEVAGAADIPRIGEEEAAGFVQAAKGAASLGDRGHGVFSCARRGYTKGSPVLLFLERKTVGDIALDARLVEGAVAKTQ